MNHLPRPAAVATGMAVGFVLVATVLATAMAAQPATAHGSSQSPPSRTYTCRFEHPTNSMCTTAWSTNSQALYDWMEVNIGDVGGRHRELIPDGQLCGAGRSKYAAFDSPGPWPVTALDTRGSGLVDLVYENTAPHATEYYRVYISKEGFDARTDSLAWDDLELTYDSGRLAASSEQHLEVPLPNRDVPAILYIVWQRSDSPEAFYSCSDVTVNGATAPSPTSTTAPTTTPSPTSTTAPTTTPSPTSTTAPTTTMAPTPSTTSAPTTSVVSPGEDRRPLVEFSSVSDGDVVSPSVPYGGITVKASDPDAGVDDGDGIRSVALVLHDAETGRFLAAGQENWSTYDFGLRLRSGRSYVVTAYAFSARSAGAGWSTSSITVTAE